MAERDGPNRSRIGRAARLGTVAGGHAARTAGTKTANLFRSREAARDAEGKQILETVDRLVTVLGSMKGAAMKLGQTLSVLDVGVVPEPYREEVQKRLATLQHMAPTVSFKEMRKVIEDDIGEKLSSVFSDFDEEPIAAASIGQVYRATLDDGRDVAVKVQYPGIKQAVEVDLKNMGMALKLLARLTPGLGTDEIAAELRERITEELDYELEAANHRALAREYRDHPFVVVPAVVMPLCRERVIVTEFVEGRRFGEVADDPPEQRSRWGEILLRFYVNGPYRHLLLNGDPHPGNSLFMDDGRVAFLDFGFFKRQTRDEVDVQLAILRAVHAHDAEALYEISKREGVISGGPELIGPLMEKYEAATWWFMQDEDIKLTPDVATRLIIEHGGMRKGFGDVRLPANQIVTLRAFGLVLGILGQLQATNNWFRISREVIFGDEPVTELGRIEAEHLAGRRGRGASRDAPRAPA